jgi:hypothetical protein
MKTRMDRLAEQERQLQQAFRAHINSLCTERVVILYYLGIVLLPLFGILDYFIAPPQLLHSFLILRLAAAVILLTILLVAYPALGKQHPALLGIIGPPIVGGSVSLMTVPMGGYESPYYAGLNLVILGVTLVMPFSLRESALTCGLVYATLRSESFRQLHHPARSVPEQQLLHTRNHCHCPYQLTLLSEVALSRVSFEAPAVSDE